MNKEASQNADGIEEIGEEIARVRKEAGNRLLTVGEFRNAIIAALRKIQEKHPGAIVGYVAGSVTSDGPEYVDQNVQRLAQYAKRLRKRVSPYVFSTQEIFDKTHQDEINDKGEEAQVELRRFWRDIQDSGYITDLFMTPGWERSAGARDEHEAALQNPKIKIHYLKELKES